MAGFVAQYPDRLVGVASVDLRKPREAVRELGIPFCTQVGPNVYIDTSAYTVKRYPRELVEYLAGHGRTKVLFGTSYPMITPQKALAGLADLNLDDEAQALFLDGNARRVFALDQDRST